MNLNLSDPKFIVLAAVVILVIAVLKLGPYVRKRRSTSADLRQKVWARIRAGGAEAWVRTKGRSETGGFAKSGLKSSRFAILTSRNANVFRNSGSPHGLVLSIPLKGAVAEADDLVSFRMKTRGYPVSDFDQCAVDIWPIIPELWRIIALHMRLLSGVRKMEQALKI